MTEDAELLIGVGYRMAVDVVKEMLSKTPEGSIVNRTLAIAVKTLEEAKP